MSKEKLNKTTLDSRPLCPQENQIEPAPPETDESPMPKKEASFIRQSQLECRLNLLSVENLELKNQIEQIKASFLWKIGGWFFNFKRRLGMAFGKSKKKARESGVAECKAENWRPEITAFSELDPQAQTYLEQVGLSLDDLKKRDQGMLFLVPFAGKGGGMHSIVQEVEALRHLGFRSRIAAKTEHRPHFEAIYSNLDAFQFFQDEGELFNWATRYQTIIATYFISIPLLRRFAEKYPEFCFGYYIQDYEPWFFKGGSEWERIAFRTYGSIPGMIHFAKTKFLAATINERHGLECRLIAPSLNSRLFVCSSLASIRTRQVNLVTMIRPETPWRQPQLTVDVLAKLGRILDCELSLHTFGCTKEALETLNQGADLETNHHGVLSSAEVAHLFQTSTIFLDLSIYQGFGRTGLEAMACGCVPILPEKSGPDTYASHHQNALLINSGDVDAAVDAVKLLVNNPSIRYQLAEAGVQTAKQFSVQKTALQEFLLFHREGC